jgi:hypothetical protein
VKPCDTGHHRWDLVGCTVYRCRDCAGFIRTGRGKPRSSDQPDPAARVLGEMLERPYRRKGRR